ncbi:transposable element Tcb1 transposase [Trichonephila clavipes]|nr:transposable element Tcb1 transposase [Trichonephila clavipes]
MVRLYLQLLTPKITYEWTVYTGTRVGVPLSVQSRGARLKWCREHGNWTVSDWGNVAFVNESRFALEPDDKHIRIWRKQANTQSAPKQHPTSRLPRQKHYGEQDLIRDAHTPTFTSLNGVSVTAVRYRDEVLEPIEQLSGAFSSGRPRETTPADDRYIVLQAGRNRRKTAEKSLDTLHRRLDESISRFTVARRLHGGLFARRPVRCVPFNACPSEKVFFVVPGTPELRDNEWGRVLYR